MIVMQILATGLLIYGAGFNAFSAYHAVISMPENLMSRCDRAVLAAACVAVAAASVVVCGRIWS